MKANETPHGKLQTSTHPISGLMALVMTALLFAVFAWVTPAAAAECDACISCHGDYNVIHGGYDHDSNSLVGVVAIFPDNGHDAAGWHGAKPYFGIPVSCSTCHASDLLVIHDNNCATCHPDPFDQLGGSWTEACQQGGCHVEYHGDIAAAHAPWDNTGPANPSNNCELCHNPVGWDVTVAHCLNCHDNNLADTTPPVTMSNALPTYEGGAQISFSMTDNGKVGIGTTYYILDGGPTVAGGGVSLNSPGLHTLEFWSIDQAGNVEFPHNTTSFQIFSETIPPTTTSDVQPLPYKYYQGAVIKLTASDNSLTGVKKTYYQINGGTTQTGTTIVIPATPGTFNYTLTYWSEDWGYNVETENTESFTVVSGSGTVTLVWGCSDTCGSQVGPGDSMTWVVRIGGQTGPLYTTGSASYPTWNGVSTITLPARAEQYHVSVRWLWNYGAETGGNDFFQPVTANGQTFKYYY